MTNERHSTYMFLVVIVALTVMFVAILSNVELRDKAFLEKCAAAGGTWLYREQKCIAAKEIKL